MGSSARSSDLPGRVALITGGSTGFGKVISLGFAEYVCEIAVADLSLRNVDMTSDRSVDSGSDSPHIDSADCTAHRMIAHQNNPVQPLTTKMEGHRGAMAMLTTLFFACGFLAALNDILIPHLKSIFELTYAQAMLVQFSFFSAFLIFAAPSGALIERIGYKGTMIIGLLAMCIGALLFIPAADLPSFPVFMCALLVLAGGITSLQVAGNPYVAILGNPATASSRLLFTQASNSLGSTIAPYFGAIFILSEDAKTGEALRQMSAVALHQYRLEQSAFVKPSYIGIAIVLALLAAAIAAYKLPPIRVSQSSVDAGGAGSIWRHRHLILGAMGIFVAVGAEVAIGSFLVSYFTQPDIGGITAKQAGAFVSLYWGGAMMGRFAGSAVMQRVRASTTLGCASLIVLALITTSILSSGLLAMGAMLVIGFFNSIMFPSIFTLGIAELGPLTGKGSGVLMAAAVGGAVIPVLQGLLADRIGVQSSFVLPALCNVYVAYYAFWGSEPARATERT